MLKIKNNFFITVFILVSIIFMAIGGYFFLLFKASSEKKVIIELRKTTLQNKKIWEEEKFLADMLDRLKKEKDIINSVFLKEDEIIRLIKSLESIGDNLGVVLKIISISPSTGKELKPKVSFIANGSFEQLFRYIYMLENIPYLVTMDKVSLQNTKEEISKKENYNWQALFNIQLEGYEKN